VPKGAHARTPSQVADLGLGLGYLLRFAVKTGSVSRTQAKNIWRRGWEALGEVARAQEEQQQASDPVGRFLELLRAALASGEAHVSSFDGGAPPWPISLALGWRRLFDRAELIPPEGSRRVGFLDFARDLLLLEPNSAYAVVQSVAARQGEAFAISERTLRHRLAERGLLVGAGVRGGRRRFLLRETVAGRRQEFLAVPLRAVVGVPSGPDGPAPDDDDGSGCPPPPPDEPAPHGADPEPYAKAEVVSGPEPVGGPQRGDFAAPQVSPAARDGVPGECPTCGGTRWWRGDGGIWVCGRCHPPAPGAAREGVEVGRHVG
jgi:hypothetical protein